jgi:hypothetical protein
MAYEIGERGSLNWSNWESVNEAVLDISSVGSQLALAGGLEGPIQGRVKVRVGFRVFSGSTVESNGYKGHLMAIA